MDTLDLLYKATELGYYRECANSEMFEIDFPDFPPLVEEECRKQDSAISDAMVMLGHSPESEFTDLASKEALALQGLIMSIGNHSSFAPWRITSTTADFWAAVEQDPGRWVAISLSAQVNLMFGNYLAEALMMTKLMPEGIDKVFCYHENPEVAHHLAEAGILHLYSDVASDVPALIPPEAFRMGKAESYPDLIVSLAVPRGLKIKIRAKNQDEIDEYLRNVLSYRQQGAIRYTIEEKFKYLFTDGKVNAEMYLAMAGKSDKIQPFADGTLDGSKATDCPPSIMFPVLPGKSTTTNVELTMSPEASRRALEGLDSKYREVAAVFEVWEATLDHFGIILDRRKMTPHRMAELREVLGVEAAIGAVLEGISIEDLY